MNKVILTLSLVLFLILFQASPLLADEVENVAPVIEEDSLIVQIIDSEGIAWGWSADGSPNPGDRAAPYILNGEQLYFEVEVSDANGQADLTGMVVNIVLLPALYFTGDLESTTIDPDTGIYRGRYTGYAIADETIPMGKADIVIEAMDPAGATDSYDPYMYEPGADILKPEVSLIINSPSVIFPQSYAGDTGVTANENPIQLIPQAVVGMEHVPVVFELSHSGTNMVNGGNIIPVGSIVWSTTPQITSNSLSVGNQIIASGVTEGTVIDVYYWLNVPMPQTEGNYSGTIDFHFIAD
jgi:hypothetical protein